MEFGPSSHYPQPAVSRVMAHEEGQVRTPSAAGECISPSEDLRGQKTTNRLGFYRTFSVISFPILQDGICRMLGLILDIRLCNPVG